MLTCSVSTPELPPQVEANVQIKSFVAVTFMRQLFIWLTPDVEILLLSGADPGGFATLFRFSSSWLDYLSGEYA